MFDLKILNHFFSTFNSVFNDHVMQIVTNTIFGRIINCRDNMDMFSWDNLGKKNFYELMFDFIRVENGSSNFFFTIYIIINNDCDVFIIQEFSEATKQRQ